VVIASIAFCPGSICAQPAGADSTASAETPKARDWLPHGTYQTNYDVNRTVQTWTQTFTTPYKFDKLQLNTNVNYSYSTDSNNDRKTVGRVARTSFNYLPLTGLKLGMSFDITRNSMETPTTNTSTKTDRDKVLVTGEYSFSPIENMSTTVSGRTGAVDELLENRTVKRSGVGRNSSLDIANSYKPWESLVWGVKLGGDLTSLDSEDSNTGLETKDRNTSESYSTSLNLTPSSRWRANVSLTRVESQFQYPKKEAQETKSGFSEGGAVSLNVKPLNKMNIDISAKSDHREIDFAIEKTRSTVTKVKSADGNLTHEMYGAKIEGRMNWENQRNEYGSGPDVDINVLSQAGYLYVRSMSGSITRPVTRRLEAKATGSISLRRYEFDDTENNADDRDLLNQNVSLDLTYTPSRKYRVGLGLSKRVDRLIYVSSKKSSNNREGETYTVQASLSYRMSPTTSISQNTRMSADYSFYEFAGNRDALIRSTSLHTVFNTKLLSRIGLALVHDYRYQDQGGVTREGGTVYYGRTGNNDRHDMTIKMDYEPVNGVKIAASQRFQEDKRFSIDGDRRVLTSENERVELLGKMEIKYQIAEDTMLDGRFERVDSTVEGKFWRITASFRRNF
jgi:hypothetical protein